MSPEDFERLLRWFGPDRDAAAREYSVAHEKLTRFFRFNYCNCPEDLADEVMNRVARKHPDLWEGRIHIAVLLGFARYVLKEYEWKRDMFVDVASVDTNAEVSQAGSSLNRNEEDEIRSGCIDSCLARLPRDDKELLLEYHRYEGAAKISRRVAMAQERGMTLNSLRLKVCRLKSVLAECVRLCCQSGGTAKVQ
jgi:hypothetical protein